MSSIIPFAAGSQLPAYLRTNDKAALTSVNKDVATGASYPTLSIKGKVFTLVKDNERKVLMRPDDPDEVLQSINLSVLRANTKSRVYYAKSYVEGDSDGARPTCFSQDGVAPEAASLEPQAKKCAVCKHAVWGSKVNDDGTPSKGTECSVNTRLAVADPDKLDQPLLLRVPAGSRKNFADAVKAAESRGIPYNALVMKVGFDKEAPSPKLTFKLTGLLDDAGYAKGTEMYESEIVRDIVGLGSQHEPAGATTDDAGVDVSELDAAIAAKAVTAKAKSAPVVTPAELDEVVAPPAPAKAKAAPKAKAPEPEVEEPAPKVKAAPPPVVAPKAAPVADMDNLLGDLDSLLGSSDD